MAVNPTPTQALSARSHLERTLVKKSVEYKRPNLDALPRDTRPGLGQVERTVWDGELLPPVRVVRIEDDQLGRQLVWHVVPPVVRVAVDLEHLVGHRREHLVYLEQVPLRVDALGVNERQREVPARAGQGLPDAGKIG